MYCKKSICVQWLQRTHIFLKSNISRARPLIYIRPLLKEKAIIMLMPPVPIWWGNAMLMCVCPAAGEPSGVDFGTWRRSKHIAAVSSTSGVMYLLSNLCLAERPYILFREWHLSSCTLWSGACIWWGLEHAVLMDELVKAAVCTSCREAPSAHRARSHQKRHVGKRG